MHGVILILLIIMTWIQNPKTRTPQTSIRWISMFGKLYCTGMSSWVPASGHWATESSAAAHLGRFALGGNPSCSLVSSQATVCLHQGWGRALWTPSSVVVFLHKNHGSFQSHPNKYNKTVYCLVGVMLRVVKLTIIRTPCMLTFEMTPIAVFC